MPRSGRVSQCDSAKLTGRPVLILDVGTLMGSLVGQTEERTRQVLQIADTMALSVVMIEEVEKAFAGVGNSGQTDSGVSCRLFGSFLIWLNDHESDVFVACTANDDAKLPPEFGRAERFDAVFFLDFPGRDRKQAIWPSPATPSRAAPVTPDAGCRDPSGGTAHLLAVGSRKRRESPGRRTGRTRTPMPTGAQAAGG